MSLTFHRAYIKRVIDGDTVEAEIYIDCGFNIQVTLFEKLRLAELDTFELRDKRPRYKQAAYIESDKLESILIGSEVWVAAKKRGKYGRWIAYLKTPDCEDVNKTMLSYHDFLREHVDDESIDLEELR